MVQTQIDGRRARVYGDDQLKFIRDYVKMGEADAEWCAKHKRTKQQLKKWCEKHLDHARSLESGGSMLDGPKVEPVANGKSNGHDIVSTDDMVKELKRQNQQLKTENDRYLKIIGKFAVDSIE